MNARLIAVLAAALLAGVLLAGVLSACTLVDTVDPRYDTINNSTEKARNQSVLLNIVRASQSAPLNFIAFSKVTGQTSTNVGVALPQFAVGPFAPGFAAPSPQRTFMFSNSSLNATLGATNSFDISVLEVGEGVVEVKCKTWNPMVMVAHV